MPGILHISSPKPQAPPTGAAGPTNLTGTYPDPTVTGALTVTSVQTGSTSVGTLISAAGLTITATLGGAALVTVSAAGILAGTSGTIQCGSGGGNYLSQDGSGGISSAITLLNISGFTVKNGLITAVT